MFTRLDVARGMAGCTGSWPRLWNSGQDTLNGDTALTKAERWGSRRDVQGKAKDVL